jgi:uncharacterized BrkB/YihY/UPF0761 family membrane protein
VTATDAPPPERNDEHPAPRRSGALGFLDSGKDRVSRGRNWATDLLDRHRNRPLVDLALRFIERDREAAGSVVGSAIAFRLFLFFVPLLLFVVGLAGFFADVVSSSDVDDAGVTGTLAHQIDTALTQPSSTRWIAVATGFIGMVTTGRTLSKALGQASCLAWQMPVRAKVSIKLMGGVMGLFVGMGLVFALVTRVRHHLGLAATSISMLGVLAVYTVGALLLGTLLPRKTTDPGALLPGAVLLAATLTGLQAISQLYLPDRFSRASELYGAIGVTIVTLGWFFFAGRAMLLAMVLDAVVFERFGSISDFIFGLPVLRILPRRWTWFRTYFDLGDKDPRDEDLEAKDLEATDLEATDHDER